DGASMASPGPPEPTPTQSYVDEDINNSNILGQLIPQFTFPSFRVRDTMSYIQRLPPELLSYIVELVCLLEAPAQTQAAATILGRVSKQWREIVFNTPAIWTSFHVSKGVNPTNLEVLLLRSGGLPVDVHVVDGVTKPTEVRDQLDALARHSSRWRNVEISHPAAFTLFENSIPWALPKLQSLAVEATSKRLPPSLVYYYESILEWPLAPDIRLGWKNRMYPFLQSLDLCDIEVKLRETEDFLEFLEAHGSLERLTFRRIWELDEYTPSRTAVLPHLKELQLRGIPSSEILRWVSAPSLHKLVVEKSPQLRLWTPVNIESNYATATNITLIHFSTAPDALLNILRAVPLASAVELVSTDLRSRASFSTENILIEHKLFHLTSLYIQGVTSLPRLKAVVEVHKDTLKDVKTHCLDLGLPRESDSENYSERDEALGWLKDQTTFKFDISHSLDAFGGHYRCHEDQRCGKQMLCGGTRCRISL
ncbi:hypothetical protein FRC01_008601, partial [Tulasnella sp. 417]